MPTKRKRGPTSRITEWEQPDKLILITGWKRNGLSDKEIAHNMHIAPRTLYKWRSESVHIMQALKRGKETANFIVENVLFQKAVQGDNTAMIFWLKNNWRDKYGEASPEERERASAEAKLAKAKADSIDGGQTPVTVNVTLPEPGKGGNDERD